MQEVKIPDFLKDYSVPEREIPIMAVQKPIEEVEQKRIDEMHRANLAETVRLASNYTLEEQAEVLKVFDERLLEAELSYRRALREITLCGYEELSARYRQARR